MFASAVFGKRRGRLPTDNSQIEVVSSTADGGQPSNDGRYRRRDTPLSKALSLLGCDKKNSACSIALKAVVLLVSIVLIILLFSSPDTDPLNEGKTTVDRTVAKGNTPKPILSHPPKQTAIVYPTTVPPTRFSQKIQDLLQPPSHDSTHDESDFYTDWRDEEEYPYDGNEYPLPEPDIVVGKQSAVPSKTKKLRFHFTRAQCSRALKGREQALIVEMLRHSWRAYRRYAWGMDELQPLSRSYNNLGHGTAGVGYMIVDTIDTLLLTGLNAEAEEAMLWVQRELSFDHSFSVSVFETNIRVLGGLLAAYELTERDFLKQKAIDLGDRLMKAFGVRGDGLPINYMRLDGEHKPTDNQQLYLSEFGSLQLEFFTLSRITGDPKYDRAARRVYDIIAPFCGSGLCPQGVNDLRQGRTSGQGSFGGMGDSYYEYLPKYYILAGRRSADEMLIRQWRKTMNYFVRNTNIPPENSDDPEWVPPTHLRGTFLEDRKTNGRHSPVIPFDRSMGRSMEHLACFSGGLFALTAMHLSNGEGGEEAEPDLLQAQHTANRDGGEGGTSHKLRTWKNSKERNLYIGEEIGATCHHMYRSSASGLSPEIGMISHSGSVQSREQDCRMRPETVESYFYLWRATKKEIYREWGREMLEAWCLQFSHPNGFVGLQDVSNPRRPPWMTEEEVQQNRRRRTHGDARNAKPRSDRSENPDLNLARNIMETFWTAESLKYMFLLFADDDVMSLDEWVFNTEAHAFRIVGKGR